VPGSASLGGGALYLSKDKKTSVDTNPDRHLAFLYFHVHECYQDRAHCPDGPDENVGIDLIKDFHGGQFDLCWCSLACMRKWFLRVLDELEDRLQSKLDSKKRKALRS
jgi:hypothetical protein